VATGGGVAVRWEGAVGSGLPSSSSGRQAKRRERQCYNAAGSAAAPAAGKVSSRRAGASMQAERCQARR